MVLQEMLQIKRLVYIRDEKCILNIVKQLDSRPPLEYLRDLANNYDIHNIFNIHFTY